MSDMATEDLDKALSVLTDEDLVMMSQLRYYGDLGEAEARIVQALSRVPQEKLDRLVKNPHSIGHYLTKENIDKLDPTGSIGLRRMEFPIKESEMITDATKRASL